MAVSHLASYPRRHTANGVKPREARPQEPVLKRTSRSTLGPPRCPKRSLGRPWTLWEPSGAILGPWAIEKHQKTQVNFQTPTGQLSETAVPAA